MNKNMQINTANFAMYFYARNVNQITILNIKMTYMKLNLFII